MKKKTIALVMAAIMLFGTAVGGTLAWLMDTTDEVENVFTDSHVLIDLTETTGAEYKMVPGSEIDKDPTVSVLEGSENCWLFVKIEESANLDTYIDYTVAKGWTALDGVDGVYYRENVSAGETFSVLEGDVVTVKTSVTEADMAAAKDAAPTLTFTAYACQYENVATADAAWANINA